MCDPVMIGAATAALSIGQAAMTYVGANQAYEANRQAANLSYAQDSNAIGRQQVQLDQERSESALDTAIASLQAQGEIAASAASSGLASSSIIRSVNAEMFGIGRNATAEEKNNLNRRVELASSRSEADLRRQNQINSRSRSSLLELGVNVGAGALQGYNAYSSAKEA